MRVFLLLLQEVTAAMCLWILFRLGLRGCFAMYFDHGHSLWEDAQWVIAPWCPFLLAWACFSLSMLTPDSNWVAVFGWGFMSYFWLIIWFMSIKRFQPITPPSNAAEHIEDEMMP